VDNLTPSQRSILATLERHGPLRMGELASIEKISAPSISGIVGRLEGRGLVSREADPKDARSTLVRSTPKANSIMNAVRQQRSAFLAARMETLTEAEISTLKDATELLKRLAAHR
jgi:DNA-binding MarR family transcriptional regulator